MNALCAFAVCDNKLVLAENIFVEQFYFVFVLRHNVFIEHHNIFV